MIKSMTGYGRSRRTLNGRDITVEARSVNNRYLDCSVKMPRSYIFAEDALKALVQKRVSREFREGRQITSVQYYVNSVILPANDVPKGDRKEQEE